MFVKMYQYYVNPKAVFEFLEIQKEATEIYRRFAECKIVHMQNKQAPAKWTELNVFESEETYHMMNEKLKNNEEISVLYAKFQSCLIANKEMKEEDYHLEGDLS